MAENFKILKEKENLLFDRREIEASIEAEVTPSRIETRKLIAEKFSVSPESVKIKKIFGKFGSRVFLVDANVYPSKEKKDAIEFKTKKEKEVEAKLAEKKDAIVDIEKETVQEKTEQEIKPEEPEVEEKNSNSSEEPIKKEIKQKEETE